MFTNKKIKQAKKLAENMQNMDMSGFKEMREILVSIHEHLEVIAHSNLKILEQCKLLNNEEDIKKYSVEDYHDEFVNQEIK